VTVRAPAKVNLQLSVGPVGGDGFHPLSTVFQAVSLYDDVTETALPAGSGIRVEAFGEDVAGVPLGADNLAARAAQRLAERLRRPADVALRIDKGIPVAGGMAGGSADAAAALLACAQLWDEATPREVLHDLAASIGSDVPFPLTGGTAIGTGRGDRLTPLPAAGRVEWLFATAHEGLSTPTVFRRFDEIAAARATPVAAPGVDDRLLQALRRGEAAEVAACLSNDLQEAAVSLRPELQRLLQRGLQAGALGAVVSGSGPTCAFVVADDEGATTLELALAGSGLCKALLRAHGPVPGARVVGG
jgi:4-diphosphocytidyl-2-C-methyl-D-erythritol kinase